MRNFLATALAVSAAVALSAPALAAPPLGIGARPPVSVPGGATMPSVQLPTTTGPAGSQRPGATVTTNSNATATAGANGRSAGVASGSNVAIAATTVGKVTAFSGTTLTVTLPTGVTKTFTVSANAFGQNRPRLGDRLAVSTDAQGNVVRFGLADQSIRGRVLARSKDTVTLLLRNGRTVTVRVAARGAARMNLHRGSNVTLTTHDGGQTSVISTK